ncbi:MAG: hypothetical protein ABR549_10635 [Mycobacteriales bacterium]
MTAPTTSPEAQAYLEAVDLELVDLPGEERRELLDDLALHLAELDDDPDVTSFEARLGSPADYARDLRDAAGLPARATTGRRRAIADLMARATGSRIVRDIRSFVPQLRPSWWVLRGYLVVLLPCLRDVTGARDFPVPAPGNSHLLGGVLVLAAVVLSVALGRRQLPRFPRVVLVAANLALAAVALSFLSDAPQRLTRYELVIRHSAPDPLATAPLVSHQRLVTNVFPYAADGTPLEGVLLYDQDGRPLPVGMQLWWADHCKRMLAPPRRADGIPVPNSYPQQYVLDPSGTTLSGVLPVKPGQCQTALTRPKVTLPVLPKG